MRGDIMNIVPINGNILVKPAKVEEKTSSGIYIPDTAQDKLNEAEIIAIAKDATDEVVVGDRVIYKGFGGTEIKLDGEDYIMITVDDLLAKYEAVDEIPE